MHHVLKYSLWFVTYPSLSTRTITCTVPLSLHLNWIKKSIFFSTTLAPCAPHLSDDLVYNRSFCSSPWELPPSVRACSWLCSFTRLWVPLWVNNCRRTLWSTRRGSAFLCSFAVNVNHPSDRCFQWTAVLVSPALPRRHLCKVLAVTHVLLSARPLTCCSWSDHSSKPSSRSVGHPEHSNHPQRFQLIKFFLSTNVLGSEKHKRLSSSIVSAAESSFVISGPDISFVCTS